MKSIVTLFGIILIIVGILAFAYQGFTYTKHEPVAQIGNINVTADKQKTVYFPPYVGGISLVAGIFLVIIARKN